MLEQVSLASLEGGVAVLTPRPEVRRLLQQRLAEVEQHVGAVLARPVQCVLEGADDAGGSAPDGDGGAAEPGAHAVNVVMNHPLVRRAMEIFNARVVRVEPTERTVRNDGE